MIRNSYILCLISFLLVAASCSIKKGEEKKIFPLNSEIKDHLVITSTESLPKAPSSVDISKVPSDKPKPTKKPIPKLKPAPRPPIEEAIKVPSVKIPSSSVRDSDFDLLDDQFEIDHGLNPFVANIPEVSISQIKKYFVNFKTRDKDLNFSQSYSKEDPFVPYSTENFLRKSVTRFHYLNIFDPQNVPSIEDFDDNNYHNVVRVGEISDKLYYSSFNYLDYGLDDLSKISVFFKIKLKNLNYISSISNITVQTGFLGENEFEGLNTFLLRKNNYQSQIFDFNNVDSYNPVTSYVINDNNVASVKIAHNYLARKNLALKILNFQFKRNNKEVGYESFLDNIKNNNATFILSTPNKTAIFYISPGQTIESFLKKNEISYRSNENGEIESLESVSWGKWDNTLSINTDLANISTKEKKQGFWGHLADLKDISKPIERGKFYVLTYSRGGDLNSTFIDNEILLYQNEFSSEITINGIKQNDKVTLILEGVSKSKSTTFPLMKEVNVLIDSGKFTGVNLIERGKCDVRYKELLSLENPLDLRSMPNLRLFNGENSFRLSEVDYKLTPIYGNNVVKLSFYLPQGFRVGLDEIIIKDFSSLRKDIISYGHVDLGNCPEKYNLNIFKTMKFIDYDPVVFKKEFIEERIYKLSVLRTGINRYL